MPVTYGGLPHLELAASFTRQRLGCGVAAIHREELVPVPPPPNRNRIHFARSCQHAFIMKLVHVRLS